MLTGDGAAGAPQHGPFVDYAAFMARRPTAEAVNPAVTELFTITRGPAERNRSHHPATIPDGLTARPFQALRTLVLPTVEHLGLTHDSGRHEHRWIDTHDHSWARLTPQGVDHADSAEHGHSLYATMIELHTQWEQHGRPEITRYGLTVHPDGTHLLWLDTPECIVRTLEPLPPVSARSEGNIPEHRGIP
ncbi:hypothetical protein [Haloactinomyces albus]|uniref:Uncharacterized protein n=1 Tax=Haloactinomyces albus TaxID=1352928 RepID=A0AAE3ZE97_9ACTN|nr:hypothetical protein [Haloactinomyces albus]MDR7303317.1 hypothetical protein [Haloactinomyces albus]